MAKAHIKYEELFAHIVQEKLVSLVIILKDCIELEPYLVCALPVASYIDHPLGQSCFRTVSGW